MKLINIYIVASVPVAIEGFKNFIKDNRYIILAGSNENLTEALHFLKSRFSGVLLIDDTCCSKPEIKKFIALVSELKAIHVIVFTGRDDNAYLKDIIRLGVKGIIHKRSGRRKILEAVRLVGEGGIYYDNFLSYSLIQQDIKNSVLNDQEIPYLSRRQKELLLLIAEGLKNKDIAKQLYISERTVDSHKTHLLKKLNFKTTAELTIFAVSIKDGLK